MRSLSIYRNLQASLSIASFLVVSSFNVYGQKGLPSKDPTVATVNSFYPAHLDFNQSLLSQLKVPEGFKVEVAATGLGKPRIMALSANGNLYVTRRDQGDVLLLKDLEEGKFTSLQTVMSKFPDVHGITIRNGLIYLCSSKVLKRAKIKADGTLSDTVTIVNNLPDGGQHDNRMLGFGPDSLLYISVGSNCNDCAETNPENATIIRMAADGSQRKIFARGLRNTIGFDWQPATHELWGADQGTDWRGDSIPPEELNRIVQDGDYGWPQVYGRQQVDQTREDPPGTTKEAYAKTTKPAIMTFPAHSAPIDLVFINQVSYPATYRGDALVSWHGSWNRKHPTGYKVTRIHFENGQPVRNEDFMTGFLSPDGKTRFGRPAGLAFSHEGDLYISDDENGIIYRVSPSGKPKT